MRMLCPCEEHSVMVIDSVCSRFLDHAADMPSDVPKAHGTQTQFLHEQGKPKHDDPRIESWANT